MYETRLQAPLPLRKFLRRLAMHALIAAGLIIGSLVLGILGYAYFEQLPWKDGFLNTAMLLGGMGPVDAPRTDAGKLFAGVFALYAGLVFIIAAGLMFGPVVHRVLHTFHWDDQGAKQAPKETVDQRHAGSRRGRRGK